MGFFDQNKGDLDTSILTIPAEYAIAFDQCNGSRMIVKFGRNTSIGTTEEDVWGAGGTIVYPTSAIIASVVSADSADTNTSGTGAHTVRLEGLDAAYAEVSETVEMNGTTPVVTTQTFLRINEAKVILSGTGESNDSAITVSLNGNVQATVVATQGINHDSHYTVPANHTAFLLNATTWQAKDTDCEVGFRCKSFGESWHSTPTFLSYRNQVSACVLGHRHDEKSDIKMVAKRITASNIDQAVFYRLYLFQNEDS